MAKLNRLAQTIAGINPNTDSEEVVSVIGGVLQTSVDISGNVTIDTSLLSKEVTLAEVRDRLPLTLGIKTADASLPVVLASDQQLSLINDVNNRVFVDSEPSGLQNILVSRNTTTGAALIAAPATGFKTVVRGFLVSNLSTTNKQLVAFRAGDPQVNVYPQFTLQTEEVFGDKSAIPSMSLTGALFIVLSNASLCDIQIQYTIEAV